MNALFIWAHRGASAAAPENTLAAFRSAEGLGADGIECDVRLSRDGVPVVIHDDTVDRTTDGTGAVRRLTLTELQRLDAGSWFGPAFSGERLPTVEEILLWLDDRLRLNLEIKDPAAAPALLDLLRSHPRARVVLSSFDHDVLERLRQADPEIPLAFLMESRFWRRAMKRAAGCGAESLNPRQDLVSRSMVAAGHRLGLAVTPYTVDDVRRLGELRRCGVDGIFSNLSATIASHLGR